VNQLTRAQTGAYSGERRRVSVILLVAANLLPLAGVLFFDWNVGLLVGIYWAENLVLGFYTLLRMWVAGGRVFLCLMFCVHYGGFCFAHGLFLKEMFMEEGQFVAPDPLWPAAAALLALFVSHGASFVGNFLRGPERAGARPADIMQSVYGRIMVLHVAIIIGGMAVASLGEPLYLLVALVVMKVVVDHVFHERQHRRMAGA
jgi:hypothetical protein